MSDLIPQQMLPMARFRHPNSWQVLDVAGASPQNDEVAITGVASKHVVLGYMIISNNGAGPLTLSINWESGSPWCKLIIPAGGVTLSNFVGIEPVSETANKDLEIDCTSTETIAASITCGWWSVPEVT